MQLMQNKKKELDNMAVGDIERLVEGLVNRGLVSPKMVGRTVGQATIDELQNLGSDITQSQTRLQREQESRLSDIQSRVAKNISQAQVGAMASKRSPKVGITDMTKPFVVGQTKGGAFSPQNLAIALPSEKGIKIKSQAYAPAGMSGKAPQDLNALIQMALENSGINAKDVYGVQSAIQTNKIPAINTVYNGSANYGSIEELMNEIARQTQDVNAFKNIFGGK